MQSRNDKNICVNDGKERIIGVGESDYYCYAIKTRLITYQDTIEDVIMEYARPVVEDGDMLFISEKMLACTQGRAIPLDDIETGFWADFLSKHVTKTPAGIGLGMPETMQCAINEIGMPRILLASAAGVVGKILGKKGWFYEVAGDNIAAIDGPCKWTIPPYNKCVVLGPENPEKIARNISQMLGENTVLIVDINDLGGKILASSDANLDEAEILELLKQNPLGQGSEGTPMGILRKSYVYSTNTAWYRSL